MKNLKCPYCGERDCVDWRVEENTKNYGGGIFHVLCIGCGELICVGTSRVCKINYIEKSDKKKNERSFS